MELSRNEQSVRRTVELLWSPDGAAARSGPRQRSSVEEIVRAAVGLADAGGLTQVSMRAVAAEVGLKPMGLYTYVPNRDVLIALMVDAVACEDGPFDGAVGLSDCLRLIADQYRDEVLRHPWLLDVPAWRPVPGPGSSRRYEAQLAALAEFAEAAGVEFDDIELDAVVAALRAFATGNARLRLDQAAEYRETGLDDAHWWAIAGPLLAEAMPAADYPVSHRVGSAVGERFAGPGNADHAYEFGLTRLIDGLTNS